MLSIEREKQIVDKIRSEKDGKAFEELVEAYEGPIFNFVLKMCGNREDAFEIVQEAFLSAYKSFHQFRGDARVKTWLFRIAANACRLKRRKRKYEPNHFLKLEQQKKDEANEFRVLQVPHPDKDPSEELLNSELRELISRAINELEAEYKSVFVLRDIEKLSTAETADVLEISVPAVKSRLHRARRYLRDRIVKFYQD